MGQNNIQKHALEHARTNLVRCASPNISWGKAFPLFCNNKPPLSKIISGRRKRWKTNDEKMVDFWCRFFTVYAELFTVCKGHKRWKKTSRCWWSFSRLVFHGLPHRKVLRREFSENSCFLYGLLKDFGERKISPKFSCITFFQIWDAPTQIPGHPGHSPDKRPLVQSFCPGYPDVWVPEVPEISCPKTLSLGCFSFLTKIPEERGLFRGITRRKRLFAKEITVRAEIITELILERAGSVFF